MANLCLLVNELLNVVELDPLDGLLEPDQVAHVEGLSGHGGVRAIDEDEHLRGAPVEELVGGIHGDLHAHLGSGADDGVVLAGRVGRPEETLACRPVEDIEEQLPGRRLGYAVAVASQPALVVSGRYLRVQAGEERDVGRPAPERNHANVSLPGQAYDRGHGRIVTQARMHVEEIAGGKANIVISELPYNVQTSTVLERIAKEVKDGRIAGVTDLRDESDFDKGMRVVVEVSRTARPDRVMADLLKHSQLQETFGCHNLALVPDRHGGVRPKRLTLREMLVQFVEFRLQVIERRTRHEIEKRRARLHIVEGLLKALGSIDEVVAIIKKSKNPDTARANLTKSLRLSDIQARAILDMPLRRLTALETGELHDEDKELRARIRYLAGLLASEEARLDVVVEETEGLRAAHATPRRTVIIDSRETVAGQQVAQPEVAES